MPEWTHFDENGNARMVDVTEKNPTIRTATAVGSLLVSEEVLSAIKGHEIKKGDVLTVAQVAGIMAVKTDLPPDSHVPSAADAELYSQFCAGGKALTQSHRPLHRKAGGKDWCGDGSSHRHLCSPAHGL